MPVGVGPKKLTNASRPIVSDRRGGENPPAAEVATLIVRDIGNPTDS